MGSERQRYVDVRIIAATSVDLEQAILEHTFRDDLYYRLSVVRIHIPPLRQRKQDLPELCHHILGQIGRGQDWVLPAEELELLTRYDWPGNVRELRNILERATILCRGPELRPSRVLHTMRQPTTDRSTAQPSQPRADNGVRPLIEVERDHILHALEINDGNLTRAAKELGISLSTMKRKMKQYSE